ncbi:uncharacterized protein DDB_G0292642-like [Hypanus sabinus]|uniref:uncharacterized protein DDB_G0292642-like n=1 Tax=Hypanus sabinus TaxID=79690 RepID=UPI0028C3C109|nr:uncharacterized protein DDB_G0292642-like [Hypanus sabinus]
MLIHDRRHKKMMGSKQEKMMTAVAYHEVKGRVEVRVRSEFKVEWHPTTQGASDRNNCGGMSRDSIDYRLTFVKRPDEITGDDDPNVYRVEMSCGHAVDPISLTEWCRIRISEGHFKFHCPAVIDGINEGCGKEWSYMEVCRHALLSVEERQDFEEKLATLAASSYCEYKQCPRCGSYVERKDEMNMSVTCSVCTANDGIPFEFCWQCMKEWKGPAPRSDKCDNEGCINIQLETLKNCDTKMLPYSNIQNCPKIRACPTCGLLIEHKDMCKYVVCIRCHVEFCFACLNTKAICSESSEYSLNCAIPVAPRLGALFGTGLYAGTRRFVSRFECAGKWFAS